jgi:hypothetical protein
MKFIANKLFHRASTIHALKEIFNQMAGFVASLVQGTLYFSIGLGRDDGLHAFLLSAFDNDVLVVDFVSPKGLRHDAIEQFGHRF